MPAVPARILPTIVISQFAATSLWFAGNAVMPDLQRSAGLPTSAVGDITIAVQALKWFTLAAGSAATADLRDNALGRAHALTVKMTPEQIAEAKRLAREWKPK